MKEKKDSLRSPKEDKPSLKSRFLNALIFTLVFCVLVVGVALLLYYFGPKG